MTIFIILTSGISLLFIGYLFFKLSEFVASKLFQQDSNELNTQPDKYIIFILLISFIILSTSFILPFLLTRKSISNDFDFRETGPIGDTIGGIMGPFINIVAVLITGLAFYMQYRANKIQVSMVDRQLKVVEKQREVDEKRRRESEDFNRSEAQFFEMLRLHHENVNGIKGNYYNHDKLEYQDFLGREVFFALTDILNDLLGLCKKDNSTRISKSDFNGAYQVLFWGYGKANKEFTGKFYGENNDEKCNPSYIEQYNGSSQLLGHYYRHLFLTVKFVVQNETFDNYDKKMRYLKILRAQLSNYEQIMLFYNWMSGYGSAWENEENKFFTEYKMIHNLWKDELNQDVIFTDKVNSLIDKYNSYSNEHKHGNLFEFQALPTDKI